jgi:hypothetical protein
MKEISLTLIEMKKDNCWFKIYLPKTLNAVPLHLEQFLKMTKNICFVIHSLETGDRRLCLDLISCIAGPILEFSKV